MDVNKMKGFLDAIEAESKQPQPSHANLARLTHLALTEMMNFLDLLCKGIVPLMVAAQVPKEAPVPPINGPETLPPASENFAPLTEAPVATAENPAQPDQPSTVQPS